jgi:methionyl aminopeptidase
MRKKAGIFFYGSVKPHYPITKLCVPNHIKFPDYALGPSGEEKNAKTISVLGKDEITKLKKSCKMARDALNVGRKHVGVGITTEKIDEIVHNFIVKELNAYPSPLNYYGFPKSVCTSVNEIICHGIPDKRPLKDGDILKLDVSVYFDGYHGDVCETILVGDVNDLGKKLVNVTRNCLDEAISIVKPGMKYNEIGKIIERIANSEGFSVSKNFCGHGIGKYFHGPPTVYHYATNSNNSPTMEVGHAFTIEPMICDGLGKEKFWPDGWTAQTVDCKLSAQFEHTIIVTDRGCDILTL